MGEGGRCHGQVQVPRLVQQGRKVLRPEAAGGVRAPEPEHAWPFPGKRRRVLRCAAREGSDVVSDIELLEESRLARSRLRGGGLWEVIPRGTNREVRERIRERQAVYCRLGSTV